MAFICHCFLWHRRHLYKSSPPFPQALIISNSFIFSSPLTHWQFLILTSRSLISHREAVRSECRAAPGGEWDLWCRRSHYLSWWPESPVWATPLGPPAYTKTFSSWHTNNTLYENKWNPEWASPLCIAVHRAYFSSGGGGGGKWQTSFDCRMLRRGIHTVPTIVSQINPLFHTSTVRPRSSRLISLDGKRNRDIQNQKKITYSFMKYIWTQLVKITNKFTYILIFSFTVWIHSLLFTSSTPYFSTFIIGWQIIYLSNKFNQRMMIWCMNCCEMFNFSCLLTNNEITLTLCDWFTLNRSSAKEC